MQLSHQRFHTIDETLSVGLGWHIVTVGDVQIVEHHGATGSYCCYAGLIEDRQVDVVVLTNTYSDIDEIGRELMLQP